MIKINWWIVGGAAVASGVGGYFAYKHFTSPAQSGYRNYSSPSKCATLKAQIAKRQQMMGDLQVQLKAAMVQKKPSATLMALKKGIALQRTILIKMNQQYQSSCGSPAFAPSMDGCDCNNSGIGGTLQVIGQDSGGHAIYGCVTGGCKSNSGVDSLNQQHK